MINNKANDYLKDLERLLNYKDSMKYLEILINILDSDRDSDKYTQKIINKKTKKKEKE